jgi:large subunit ribosomal protein L3
MANQQIGLLGRKLGMTQFFEADGSVRGVTVIEAAPNVVLRVKTPESDDGYSALQVGIGARKAGRATKAELGHAKKAGLEAAPRVIREVRVPKEEAARHTAGGTLTIAMFAVNELVDVQGNSKGRGFAGVMKRHNFSGFHASHGVHEYYRHGGSIGTRLTPGMTFAGMKMPGRMGATTATVQNLRIVKVDAEKNLLFVLGSAPGADGDVVLVRKAVKGG